MHLSDKLDRLAKRIATDRQDPAAVRESPRVPDGGDLRTADMRLPAFTRRVGFARAGLAIAGVTVGDSLAALLRPSAAAASVNCDVQVDECVDAAYELSHEGLLECLEEALGSKFTTTLLENLEKQFLKQGGKALGALTGILECYEIAEVSACIINNERRFWYNDRGCINQYDACKLAEQPIPPLPTPVTCPTGYQPCNGGCIDPDQFICCDNSALYCSVGEDCCSNGTCAAQGNCPA